MGQPQTARGCLSCSCALWGEEESGEMGTSRKKPGFWSVSPVKRDTWSQPGCWVLCVLCILSIPAPCGKTSLQLCQGGKLKEHPPSRGLEAECWQPFFPSLSLSPSAHPQKGWGSSLLTSRSCEQARRVPAAVLGSGWAHPPSALPAHHCSFPCLQQPALCYFRSRWITGSARITEQPGCAALPSPGMCSPTAAPAKPPGHGHVLMERMQEEGH